MPFVNTNMQMPAKWCHFFYKSGYFHLLFSLYCFTLIICTLNIMFLPLKISVHFLLQMQFSHSINSISDFHCSFTYIINAILCFEHYTFHFMCHLSCRIFSSVLSLVLPLQNLFQLLATSNAAFFSIACISDFHSSFLPP